MEMGHWTTYSERWGFRRLISEPCLYIMKKKKKKKKKKNKSKEVLCIVVIYENDILLNR